MKIDYETLFCQRLAQFRAQKNISARKMSLDLGFSESYINKIENGKTLPALEAFFHICYYLNVEPKEFFTTNPYSVTVETTMKDFCQLSLEQQARIQLLIKDILSS